MRSYKQNQMEQSTPGAFVRHVTGDRNWKKKMADTFHNLMAGGVSHLSLLKKGRCLPDSVTAVYINVRCVPIFARFWCKMVSLLVEDEETAKLLFNCAFSLSKEGDACQMGVILEDSASEDDVQLVTEAIVATFDLQSSGDPVLMNCEAKGLVGVQVFPRDREEEENRCHEDGLDEKDIVTAEENISTESLNIVKNLIEELLAMAVDESEKQSSGQEDCTTDTVQANPAKDSPTEKENAKEDEKTCRTGSWTLWFQGDPRGFDVIEPKKRLATIETAEDYEQSPASKGFNPSKLEPRCGYSVLRSGLTPDYHTYELAAGERISFVIRDLTIVDRIWHELVRCVADGDMMEGDDDVIAGCAALAMTKVQSCQISLWISRRMSDDQVEKLVARLKLFSWINEVSPMTLLRAPVSDVFETEVILLEKFR